MDFKLYQHDIYQHGIASKQIGVYTGVKLQIQNTVEWKPISCFLVEGFMQFNGQFLLSKIKSLCVKFSLKISCHNVQKLLIPIIMHSQVLST